VRGKRKMEAETFVKIIGEEHIIKTREVSDKIDQLSDKEKSTLCNINDEIITLLCNNINPKNHLLAIEALLVTTKYSQLKSH